MVSPAGGAGIHAPFASLKQKLAKSENDASWEGRSGGMVGVHTIGRVKAFGCDECRLSGKDTLSGVNEGQVLLLITVEPHGYLSGLAAVIQHQGRRVGLGNNKKRMTHTVQSGCR